MPRLTSRLDTVVISGLSPLVDGGKYPAKRIPGEETTIQANIFKDGHDVLAAELQWRKARGKVWKAVPMAPLDNDRWEARIRFPGTGFHEVRITAWADAFLTWIHDFERRLTGDQKDFSTEIEEGRLILAAAARRAAAGKRKRDARDASRIETLAAALAGTPAGKVPALFSKPGIRDLLARWPDTRLATTSDTVLRFDVERELACFSSWYEFFPRSAEGIEGKHSTLRDCLPRIEYAAAMGFDVVYFPPIHPIGTTHRKGKNNTLRAEPGDVGSPWAIGGEGGGHRSVAAELGTIEDFEWLVDKARGLGVEIALDFAINCSPDHPYVRDHPEWFFHRPDGSIKYAENPPKKYQDIYPLDFHCDDWKNLWTEMRDVVLFWAERGVSVFRVDNPHTKPVAFWEWLIGEVRKRHSDTIFLAEAFTRPRMMETLGKIGFSQSYTYFTWRETKEELADYVTELTRGPMREFYRGNFWPNTPDILAFHLWNAPPAAFKIRAALAATLMPSWGIYSGYEFCENAPLPPKEEYLDSEKYQLVARDWDRPGNIVAFLTKLNRIRKSEPAFRRYANIAFVPADNDRILAYWRWSDDRDSIVLIVVNLDPENEQHSNIHLPLEDMGLPGTEEFEVHDLLFGERYLWRESTNFVLLDPRSKPVHVLKIK